MLETTLPQRYLREVLAPFAALTEDAVLHTGPDGVVITATSPDTVATITSRLEPTAFTTYDDTELTTGINCTTLTRLLDATTRTTTALDVQDPAHYLHLTTGNLTIDHATIDHSLIHTQSPTPTPTQNATITLPINSRPLELAREATALCTETITLDTTTETLTCHATGDTDSMTVEFTPTDLHAHNETPTTATYPITHLTTLFNTLPADDRPVTLTFATNSPLRIRTTLADNHATLTTHIAPHST